MELEGKELDAAVARLERLDVVYRDGQPAFEHTWDPELHCHEDDMKAFKMWVYYKPSSCWSDGGPLIERERIGFVYNGDFWTAWPTPSDPTNQMHGPTPLIAAMRAFVASKG